MNDKIANSNLKAFVFALVGVGSVALTSFLSFRKRRTKKNKLPLTTHAVGLQNTALLCAEFSDNSVLRGNFRQSLTTLSFVEKWPRNHTHPSSASERSVVSRWMCDFIKDNGLLPYGVNPSKHFQSLGHPNCSTPYWGKDLGREIRSDPIPDNACFHLVDVDYHMESLIPLVVSNKPILMYTHILSRVAGTNREQTQFQKKEGEEHKMTVIISGGGSYTHQLWDYSGDMLVFRVGSDTYYYNIEKVNTSLIRGLVLLAPLCVYRDYLYVRLLRPLTRLFSRRFSNWLFPSIFPECGELDRLRPVSDNGGYALLRVKSKLDYQLSISKAGSPKCVTIPYSEFQTCEDVLNLYKSHTPGTLSTYLMSLAENDRKPAAVLMSRYFQDDKISQIPLSVFHKHESPQFSAPKVDVSAGVPKVSLDHLFEPVDNTMWLRSNTIENLEWGYEERVEKQQENNRRSPQQFSRYFSEFIDWFVSLNRCQPKSIECQMDARRKPNQKARIWADTMKNSVAKVLRVFSKKEPSGILPKPDRIISTFDQEHQLNQGRYTASLMETMLANMPSLCFRRPIDVSHHLGRVASRSYVVCADFSRMDGNVGPIARMIEKKIIERIQGREAWLVSNEYHRGHVLVGSKQKRMNYERGSGSPETAAFNSILNYVLWYSVLRTSGFTVKEAREIVTNDTAIAGDDSCIGFNEIPKNLFDKVHEVAGWLGQTLTVSKSKLGEKFEFCSRFYIVGGGPNSCCNLRKAIGKFHLSKFGVLPEQVTQRAVEKAQAYFLTDSNSPIIGDWAASIINKYGDFFSPVYSTERWQSSFSHDEQFINERESWMDELLMEQYDHAFDVTKFNAQVNDRPLRMDVCVNLDARKSGLPIQDHRLDQLDGKQIEASFKQKLENMEIYPYGKPQPHGKLPMDVLRPILGHLHKIHDGSLPFFGVASLEHTIKARAYLDEMYVKCGWVPHSLWSALVLDSSPPLLGNIEKEWEEITKPIKNESPVHLSSPSERERWINHTRTHGSHCSNKGSHSRQHPRKKFSSVPTRNFRGVGGRALHATKVTDETDDQSGLHASSKVLPKSTSPRVGKNPSSSIGRGSTVTY